MTFTASELAAEAGVRKHGAGFLQKALSPVANWRQGWRIISEAFAGAWQRNIEEKRGDLTCYPTLYACLNRISQDIGKLPFLLKEVDSNSIWKVNTTNSAHWPVLRKPNEYQTAQQFREAWLLSKLLDGNTYVLKGYDERGVVNRMWILDPCRVIPMVSERGSVFYQLNYQTGENLLPLGYPGEQLIIPARDIIHDRLNCFHHQLIGVPPLCAAHWPAVKNLKILKDATQFFANGAQPGGILTAPAGMSEDDAKAVKEYWDTNFTGENRGKVGVIGADMKYVAFAFKAADSQLVEQMRYSDEQICQPFGVHPFIVGIGTIPSGLKTDDITNVYYQFALQAHIEAMEALLDQGLELKLPLGVELDLNPLLRMDFARRAEVMGKLVGDGIATPNEGRFEFGYSPLDGGDTVYMQQQDFPLDQVRKNRIEPAPAAPVDPPPATNDPAPEGDEVRSLRSFMNTKTATDAMRSAARHD